MVAAKSMRIALDDLRLAHLFVVYPGAQSYALDEYIEVLAIGDLSTRILALKLRH